MTGRKSTTPCECCGTQVERGWDYCTSCGYPMGEPKTPPQGTQIELVYCGECACHYLERCRLGHPTSVVAYR